MNNPEQQPTSNLQTLEAELSLTKAEMEEFRKLPKEEQDKQKDEKLEKLKALQEGLDEAIQEAIRTGELDEVKILKETLNKEITDLEEIFNTTERLEKNILKIDRTVDVIEFTGWNGSEIKDEDTDTRSTSLTEIDLSKLKLDTSWLGGESEVSGEKRLEALKASGNIRLDAQILITLINLPYEELEEKMEIIATANGIKIEDLESKDIFFDGTIIRELDTDRYSLYLRFGGNEWAWDYYNLVNNLNDNRPSLVLESDSV